MNSLVLSLIHLLVITSFLSINNHQSTVLAADTTEYTNCSKNIICGSVESNISYPFWGLNREEYCGKSEFLVTCDGTVPVFTMEKITFRLLGMNTSSGAGTPTVKVARQDYWGDICPSEYIATNLDFSLFDYASGPQNVTFYYGCNSATNALLVAAGILVNGTYKTCSNGDTVSFLTETQVSKLPPNTLDPVTSGACEANVLVPVSAAAAEKLDKNETSTIQTAIDGGFDLNVQNEAAIANDCTICVESGGVCGQDTTTGDFRCHCATVTTASTCTGAAVPAPAPAPKVQKCFGVDDEQYLNCSKTIQCANMPSIGYPFWGSTRPDYCGLPELFLNCSGDAPSITIQNQQFRVLSVIQTQNSLRIAQADYWHNVCPSTFTNSTTLDNSTTSRVLEYGSDVQQLMLFYSCPALSIPLPQQFTSQFNCTSSTTSVDSINYFVTEDPIEFGLGNINLSSTFGICETTVIIRVSQSAALNLALNSSKENLRAAIDSGFEVKWDASNSLCEQCQGSGGQCGYNTSSTDFTCFCKNGPNPSNCTEKKNQIAIGLAVGGAILFGIFVGFYVYYFLQRKKKKQAALAQSKEIPSPLTSNSTATPSTNVSQFQSIPSYPSFNSKSRSDLGKASTYFGVQVFSYTELEEATENFNPAKELGDGGFGTVYYGKLNDGRIVAVKRLYENNFKRVEQFMNEVEILTRLEHRNLVKLYGCTSRRSRELLLVYEYISNGTVADHLHGKRVESGFLSWPVRLSIAIETADALAFLHRNDVIHRDVKTNNILLDDEYLVKVADFGLSRLFPNDQTHVSTAPQGTPGYVDPEYYQCYQLTDKSDVYSFGVVLIELISSLQAVDTNRHRHDINLANLAINKIQNHLLNELVDSHLGFETDYSVRRSATAVAELAFRCLQQEKDMRPTMEEVLEGLKAIQKEELGDHENGKAEAVVLDINADDVGLLRNMPPPLSPDSVVTDKLVSSSPATSSF